MRVRFIDRFGASFKNKIPTTVGRARRGMLLRSVTMEKKNVGPYIHIAVRSLFSAGSVMRLGIIDRTRWRTPARRRTSTTVTASISSDPSTSNTIAVFSLSFSFSVMFARRSPLPYSIRAESRSIALGTTRNVATSGCVRPATSHAHTRGIPSVCWTGGGLGSSRTRATNAVNEVRSTGVKKPVRWSPKISRGSFQSVPNFAFLSRAGRSDGIYRNLSDIEY